MMDAAINAATDECGSHTVKHGVWASDNKHCTMKVIPRVGRHITMSFSESASVR